MAISKFGRSLKVSEAYEGGLVDHSRDPGGRTAYGITQRVYDAWRDRMNKPRLDVFKITSMEVSLIYQAQYWDKVRGSALPDGIDVVVFDGAVNSGPVQSIKWLQRALGTVKVDGMIGEVTLAAVAEYPDHDRLVALILDRRLAFLKALRTWKTFGRGWQRRVDHLRMVGQALATGSVPPAPEYFSGGEAKATIADARAAMSPSLAAGTSGGGGVAALLSTAQAQLEPFIGTSEWIERAVAVLAVAGVACMVGGAGYAWWIGQRNTKLASALDIGTSEVVT